MPELPEVETIVRALGPRLVGRRIADFRSSWPRNVAPSLREVRAALRGRIVRAVRRRAKFIVWELDDGAHLLVHLRMSGRLAWAGDSDQLHRHVRANWTFDDGARLLFDDARKFGRIIHTRDIASATGALGPEPLAQTFTPAALAAILERRSRFLKPLLLDQAIIAGLGNIYTDEALHRAGLHPLTAASDLKPDQVGRLHSAIRQVLREGIRRNGTSIDWIYPEGRMQNFLRVYGRAGEPCRACGTAIAALRVGQRGTHICPKCQILA